MKPVDAEEPINYSLSAYLREAVRARVSKHPVAFSDLEQWRGFREVFLAALLAECGLPDREPMRSRVIESIDSGGCRRERVAYHFAGSSYASGHVWSRPDGAADRPGVVLSPGYGQHKWDETFNRLAQAWAAEGFVVIIVDHAPFGERERSDQEMINLVGVGSALGMPNIAMRAFENMRALDYLASRPDVDGGRIGITGLCQGGMDTWLAGALDERFRAVCPVCSATTHAAWALDYNVFSNLADPSPYIPNLLKHGDVQHIHAAIAPRPLLVQANISDNWWPLSGYRQIVDLCESVYRLHGVEERFAAHADAAHHNITPPFDGRALAWFRRWL